MKTPTSIKSLAAAGGLMTLMILGADAQVIIPNILSNPNLDAIGVGPQNGQTPVGWDVVAARATSGTHLDACSSEPWCNVFDPGGYGLFFKPFQGQAGGNELTVFFSQDNPASSGTKFRLSGYLAAEGNYSGYFNTNLPPPQTLLVVQFLDNASSVIASNGYDLVAAGLPNGGPGSMGLFTTPQYTAPVGTATVRAGAMLANVYGTAGQQSAFADSFTLELEAPPGSPVITNPPVAATASTGGNASFTVGVSNTAGVTYQWQMQGTNLVNGGSISGATSQTLNITGASASNVGRYRVVVANSFGTVFSPAVPLALQDLHFYPVVEITGRVGDTYRVDYSTQVAPATWIPFRTNTLTVSPTYITDTGSPGSNTRFYRSVFLY